MRMRLLQQITRWILLAAIMMLLVKCSERVRKVPEHNPMTDFKIDYESMRNVVSAIRKAAVEVPPVSAQYNRGQSQRIVIDMGVFKKSPVLEGYNLDIRDCQLWLVRRTSITKIEFRWVGRRCKVSFQEPFLTLSFENSEIEGDFGAYCFHLYSPSGIVWRGYLRPDPAIVATGATGERALLSDLGISSQEDQVALQALAPEGP